MDNCILCGEPAPNGLCKACIEELFSKEPVQVVTLTEAEKRPHYPVRDEAFFSSLEDADSAGYPTNYV